jgi:hypothetical protein
MVRPNTLQPPAGGRCGVASAGTCARRGRAGALTPPGRALQGSGQAMIAGMRR